MSRVVAEIVVVPFVGGPGGLSRYVAAVEKTLRSFNLEVMLTPMGTILEGEIDEVLNALKAAHEVPFNMGAMRVSTTIKIDDRRDRELTMTGKVRSVEDKM